MPITEKTLLPLDLAGYDVYIEERNANSDYFQISSLPSVFTGGKNSFLIGGSSLLQEGSEILIEIIDSEGNPIFQTLVPEYVKADARMISVEIYDTTASGPATLIIMGKAILKSDGTAIPPEWENIYNVRWAKQIIVDYNINNTSPIVFENTPEVSVVENRFLNLISSSYITQTSSISASLNPSLYAGVQSGYLIGLVSPSEIKGTYINPTITGSLTINGETKVINLPITKILNNQSAYTYAYYIESPVSSQGTVLKQFNLRSGSYTTNILDKSYVVTSSAKLQYDTVITSSTNIPISFANLRVSNLSTVSGELYKIRVYNKVATSVANYKLIGDVIISTEELLTTSSVIGDLPIGDMTETPNVSNSWYAGELTKNVGFKNLIYPISGTLTYYNPSVLTDQLPVVLNNSVLLSSINTNLSVTANSPLYIIPNTTLTSSRFTIAEVSESGYFIGTKQFYTLFPTSEYTLQLDAYYRRYSGSAYLSGVTPKVDIYLIGMNEITKIASDNPLGQNIGTLTVSGDSQWFEQKQFNFKPAIASSGKLGLRFVVSNGFWNFSNISLKPASDPQFSPDEVQMLIPNTEYYNELLQYKLEFFDINGNSANIYAASTPTYFSGSNIDLGTLS